jgi:hypothetical protein
MYFSRLIFTVVLLAASQAMAQVPARLTDYVATPAHQARTLEQVRQTPRLQLLQCAEPASFSASTVSFAATKKLRFGRDGTPERGIWSEQVTVAACGQTMQLSVAYIVDGAKWVTGPMAPGDSHADPIAQGDALRAIVPLIKKKIASCGPALPVFFNSAYRGPLASAGTGGWLEHWDLLYCDKHIEIPITFAPDDKDGYFIDIGPSKWTVN